MLSRKGGLAALFAALLVLVAGVTRVWPLAVAAIPLGVALLFGSLWGLRPKARLTVNHRFASDRLLSGDVVDATFRLNARGASLGSSEVAVKVPSGLEVEGGAASLFTPLGQGQSVTGAYAVRATEMGAYRVKGLRGRERGVLGLFVRELPARGGQASLEVSPGRDPLEGAPLLVSPRRPVLGTVRAHRRGMGSEFYALREYAPGDPFEAVNWKSTAKHRRPMVNEREQESPVDLVVLLDARAPACVGSGTLSTVEAGARAVVSIAEAGLDERLKVGLVVVGEATRWVQPGVGRGHLRRIRGVLSRVMPGGDRALDRCVALGRERFPRGVQVVVVSGAVDASLRRFVRKASRLGVACGIVSPCPVVAADAGAADGEKGVTSLRRVAARLARVERGVALEQLRRAGAVCVVDWDPRDPLGAAVAGVASWRA